jgi:hypothetical protein
MKSNIFAVLLVFTLFSCKDEKKPAAVETPKEKASQTFDVTLNVTVKKDDSFHLFYTEDETINFDEKQSVWVELKGKETSQDVVFRLPEDVIPTHLRLDFGINKEQEDMTVNNFKMEYMGKKFEAKGPDFFTYFYPNLECTNVDKEKGLVMPIKKGDAYTGPMFYPQIGLTDQINLLVK